LTCSRRTGQFYDSLIANVDEEDTTTELAP
jgi:hypothetical protein